MTTKQKTWTVWQMQATGACYKVERIRALWAERSALSLADILALDIPTHDRLWVCWRPDALTSDQRARIIERIVRRAVEQYARSAESWLATRAAAGAAEAAEAAGAAAWAAARAAAEAAARAAGAAGAAARAAARAAGAAEYDRQIADVLAVLADGLA